MLPLSSKISTHISDYSGKQGQRTETKPKQKMSLFRISANRLIATSKELNGTRRSIGGFWKSKGGDSDISVISSARQPKEIVPSAEELAVAKRPPLPIIIGRDIPFPEPGRQIRQAWVENMDAVKETKLGLIDLHPGVFGAFPHMDLIRRNVAWQLKFRTINWNWAPTRAEVAGTNKKPWPQKGTGRARHGSRKSPIFLRGGAAHGPRGPTSYYWMPPFYTRVNGLISTLSVKFAQDDLKIVDSLDIPSDNPKFLQDLIEERKWGLSVLFVDDTDLMPQNITLATETIGEMNLMPVYGLNVFSMLKHETLVLTLAAVNRIEERLLFQLHRHDPIKPDKKLKL